MGRRGQLPPFFRRRPVRDWHQPRLDAAGKEIVPAIPIKAGSGRYKGLGWDEVNVDAAVAQLITRGDGGVDLAALRLLHTDLTLDAMMDALEALDVQQSWSAAMQANSDPGPS